MSEAQEEQAHLEQLLGRMAELEGELEKEIRRLSDDVVEELVEKRESLERDVRAAQQRLHESLQSWLARSEPRNLVSAPFIYAMVVPIAFLDLTFFLYQAICFRLYRIPLVRRADWIVIDRHRLPYLNAIEKLNCIYCGYANGVLAYAVEIAARTEQYWCPIKHARRAVGTHLRYRRFLEYGDGGAYRADQEKLRSQLAEEPDARDLEAPSSVETA